MSLAKSGKGGLELLLRERGELMDSAARQGWKPENHDDV